MFSKRKIIKTKYIQYYGERRRRAKPHVYGSRNDGSYTKRDNEEPKLKRKMRQASQKINRGK